MTRLFEAKPFIIAEVGSNWTNFEQANDSIAMAKQCGADAVKFQAFSHSALFGLPYADWGDGTGSTMQGELPLAWLPKLKEKADACGIEFMCTAFSPELVAAVDPFVEVHKIASSDLSHVHLLKAVAKTGKPIILSTGASSRGDISLALATLGEAASRTVLMYCNAAYPSRWHNLYLMRELQAATGRPVGLSDHSLDVIFAPLAAHREFGAVVIEKHFTAFPDLDTPDRGHSLTVDEFKVMVDYIRGKRDSGGFNPTSEERAMVLRHNRRLIATQDIASGTKLKYGENFGAYRSLEDDMHGLTPFVLEMEKTPEGKRATKAIARGKGIGPGDFA